MSWQFMVELPVRTTTESNTLGHWAAKARRAKSQRQLARMVLQSSLPTSLKAILPSVKEILVALVRIGPRSMDDDNLQSALKHVRDGIADAIGIDDGDSRYRWSYSQAKGDYNVDVRIEFIA